MHESHVVADLIARIEAEVDPRQERVDVLTLQVGALSGIPLEALRLGVRDRAVQTWGYAPEVMVSQSNDLDDRGAFGVILTSIKVGG